MSNRTAVITGASRGIGRAIALKYAKEGYRIAVCCLRNTQQLEEVRQEAEALWHSRCLCYTGDMGEYSQAEDFFRQILQTFGAPDILVNNAGISHIGLLQDMRPQEWERLLQTNLTSVFNCCHLAVPPMLSRKQGKIINISSVWGSVGASMEAAYSATKGGVNALTRALAKELAPSGIQVNAVACGVIDTEMNHFLSQEELSALTQEIPTGRMGTPEEVADLVYSLSQGNGYLTGQIITMDGGWL